MKNSKLILFVFLGVAFWFNGAMGVKYFGESVFTENNPKLILAYLLLIPFIILAIIITKIVGRLKYDELLRPLVIITFTAIALDGIALSWFRELYHESFEVALHGAAWILWGGAIGLFIPFVLENRSKKQENK